MSKSLVTSTMSTDRTSEAETGARLPSLLGGALGGLVGALAFGLLAWALTPEMLRAAIPPMYGLEPTTAVGWAIHLLHGVILGVVFGAIVRLEAVDRYLDEAMPMGSDAVQTGVLGLFYGVAVWAILPVIVMPAWLTTVGYADAPTVPAFAVESFLGHVAYGASLGAVYGLVAER